MTDKQALAYAKHELEYYKQVERDGIKMVKNIEFYEKVVYALEKLIDGYCEASSSCSMYMREE